MSDALAAAVRGALSAADAGTASLQEDVTHEAYIEAIDHSGTPGYAAPVTRTALVQRKRGTVPTAGGREFRFRAVLSFLRPFPLSPRDRIRLSDGSTGPIHTPTGGHVDPSTGEPFARTVYLGGA